jgi:outer membrane lipoprotein-sorting protein
MIRSFLAVVAIALLPLHASAMTKAQEVEVERIRTYLNNLTTLEAKFRQVDGSSKVSTGRFWLHRPHRLRFEYDPPNPILIIARGSFLVHYDAELREEHYFDQDETPAWFLLRDDVQLGKDVVVSDVQRNGPLVAITATQRGHEGAITLVFNHTPIRLLGWQMVDANGNLVRLNLTEQKVGEPIDPDLFQFQPKQFNRDFGR